MSSTWSCRTGFTPINRRGLAMATSMHRSAGSYHHRFEIRSIVRTGESGALVRRRRRESLGQPPTFLPACSGCGGKDTRLVVDLGSRCGMPNAIPASPPRYCEAVIAGDVADGRAFVFRMSEHFGGHLEI